MFDIHGLVYIFRCFFGLDIDYGAVEIVLVKIFKKIKSVKKCV